MPRIVHFEISADEPERAVRFYHNVFGWDIKKWEGPIEYWMVTTGPDNQPGINGRILKRRGSENVVNTIEVDAIDVYAEKINQHGCEIVVPKSPIPGVGWVFYCKDTEGNTLGVFQTDPSAK
jgi:hypothetical protein